MQLFLDTAQTADWTRLMPLGLFHGITTNPLLAARAGLSYADINWTDMAQQAADLGAQELHAQVFGPPETYLAWSGGLMDAGARAGLRCVVKVPLTERAIRKVPALKANGCPILMTACYDAKQMLVAAALGADYIAPYVGRMQDAGLPAMQHLETMLNIAAQPGVPTRVMAASLRTPEEVVALTGIGCDCVTIGSHVVEALLSNPETQAAVAQFEAAAARTLQNP